MKIDLFRQMQPEQECGFGEVRSPANEAGYPAGNGTFASLTTLLNALNIVSQTRQLRGSWVHLQLPICQHFDCGKVGSVVPPIRVLIVEDFVPFRRFTCSTLQKKSELQVICEVSDGLEAVQKADELKPDLILLDIGLPGLNGIEAARQIRKLSPESKIIFLSQESSTDVVQSALSLGAWGYVVKTRAKSDLLVAIDAVILEKQFVST